MKKFPREIEDMFDLKSSENKIQKKKQTTKNPNRRDIVSTALKYMKEKNYETMLQALAHIPNNNNHGFNSEGFNNFLSGINEADWSETLAKTLAMLNGYCMKYIPKKYITEPVILLAIDNMPYCIKYIPHDLITSEIAKIAVERNPGTIQYINHDVLTSEIVDICVKKHYYLVSYIPDDLISKELSLYVATKLDSLRHLRDTIKNNNYELFETAIKTNPENIQYLKAIHFSSNPDKLTQLCELAIDLNPNMIFKVSPTIYDGNLWVRAFLKNPKLIDIRNRNTPEIFEKVLEQNGMILEFISEKFQTRNLCLIALNQNREAIKFVKI